MKRASSILYSKIFNWGLVIPVYFVESVGPKSRLIKYQSRSKSYLMKPGVEMMLQKLRFSMDLN